MATTYTPNFNLGKQEDLLDRFDMSVITRNADIIDEELHKRSTDTENEGKYLGKTETAAAAVLDDAGGNIAQQLATLATNYLKAYETGTHIPSGSDLDDYMTAGSFRANNSSQPATLENCPVTVGFRMEVKYVTDSSRPMQTIFPNSTQGYYFSRNFSATGWGSWYKFSGEEVPTTTTT